MSAQDTPNNKLTKGIVAAALGTVLLLGGAGTLAYWNDCQSVSARSRNDGVVLAGVF